MTMQPPNKLVLNDLENIAGFGKKGHGKTRLFKTIIKEQRPRAIIIDPNREHTFEEYNEITRFKNKVAICETPADIDKNFDIIVEKNVLNYVVICHFNDKKIKDFTEYFDFICRSAHELRNNCLHIEEVHNFTGSNKIPKGLEVVCSQSRHGNMSFQLTNVTPTRVNRLLVSQADYVAAGKLKSIRDREYFSEDFDDISVLKTMPQYKFLVADTIKDTQFYMMNDLTILGEPSNLTSEPQDIGSKDNKGEPKKVIKNKSTSKTNKK